MIFEPQVIDAIIEQDEVIDSTISINESHDAVIAEPRVIDAEVMIDEEIVSSVAQNDESIDAVTEVVIVHNSGDYDYYDGTYHVIPKAYDEQILPTREKIMRDDVTVDSVPYYETHNEKGTTIYIASEV